MQELKEDDMMRFSIIVPVYNVEKYLDKCLNSIAKQTYENFEAIIVNDGSPDNSQQIIDCYVKKDRRFKSYRIENSGLSAARNFALEKVTGDYILFLDSDDYLNNRLFEKLNNVLCKDKVDLVRFSCCTVDEKGKELFKEENIEYYNEKAENIIEELVTRKFVEAACFYCYNKQFWEKYNFKYEVGKVHEDYGLTPLIIYYAKSITSINYLGYYYVQRDNSITKTKNYKKIKKGVYDMYCQYKSIVKKLSVEKNNITKKVILSYVAECAIIKGRQLENKDLNEYIKILKKDKVVNNISGYNIKKKIKKIIATFSIKLYIKIFK